MAVDLDLPLKEDLILQWEIYLYWLKRFLWVILELFITFLEFECKSKIFPYSGGAAEKSGKIKAGDEIIAINGVSTEKQSRVEVWNKMKELPQGTVIISFR